MMRADDILPDHVDRAEFAGQIVRKGTVAAFLYNARAWSDVTTSDTDRTQIERDILEAVPALRALGLFEVLSLQDAALVALVATCQS